MTYVLHGARGSGSCAVECVLAEIGADYELRELSLRDGEHQGDEYARGQSPPQGPKPRHRRHLAIEISVV